MCSWLVWSFLAPKPRYFLDSGPYGASRPVMHLSKYFLLRQSSDSAHIAVSRIVSGLLADSSPITRRAAQRSPRRYDSRVLWLMRAPWATAGYFFLLTLTAAARFREYTSVSAFSDECRRCCQVTAAAVVGDRSGYAPWMLLAAAASRVNTWHS